MRQKTRQAAVVLVLVMMAGPAVAGKYGVVGGVNIDAVPWSEFCAATKPVPVERGGRRCAVGHPASEYFGTFRDFSGRGKNPPANCDIVSEELRRWTTPTAGSSDPWRPCRVAWGWALQNRATQPERFVEPFSAWRKRYFAEWLVGGEQ